MKHLDQPSTGTVDPGGDEFDQDVNYGGYRYHMFFGNGPYRRPLPTTPPPAASYSARDRCECPHCDSEGWYAQSPFCKFWRFDCELCAGTRLWSDFSSGFPPPRRPCDLCESAWRQDVRLFRDALHNPRATARRLRDEARQQRARQNTGDSRDQQHP